MSATEDRERLPGAPPSGEGGHVDAFVSYARSDLALDADSDGVGFIDRLIGDLERAGREIWLDRSDIEPAAEWRSRIARGIEGARSLLFVLTPDSARSAECARELAAAVEHHKRIIPVVLRAVPDEDVPPALRAYNWINARSGDGYQGALADVTEALAADLEWRDAHTRLQTRAREWIDAGRDRSYLLRGRDLRSAEDWHGEKDEHAEQPTDAQYRYITASRRATTRRQGALLASVTVALVLAVALAIVALLQRSAAIREQHQAEASAFSALSLAHFPANFDFAGPESIEAYRIEPSVDTRSAVVTALEQPTTAILRGHHGTVNAVAFSPDGADVASGGEDGTLRLWNVVTRREIGRPVRLIGNVSGYQTGNEHRSGQVTAVAYSQNGGLLAAASAIDTYTSGGIALASERGLVTLFDTAHGLRRLAALTEPGRSVQRLAFSPDGSLLAVANDDGSVALVRAQSGIVAATVASGSQAPVPVAVAFSPDGSELAYSNGQSVRFWDIASGQPTGPVIAVAADALSFDPAKPGVLAVGSFSGPVELFDARSGAALSSYLTSLTTAVNDVAFSPSGGRIAVAISDATEPILIDVSADGTMLGPVEPLAGAATTVTRLAFSASSSEVATADADGTVRIYTVPGLSGLAHALRGSTFGSASAVAGATVAAVNTTNATNPSTAIALWSLGQPGAPPREVPDRTFSSTIALSPHARLLATASNGSAQLFSVTTRNAVGRPMAMYPNGDVPALTFSPDGSLLAGVGAPDAYVYRVSSQRLAGPPLPSAHIRPQIASANQTDSAVFSPDGKILAVGDLAGQVRLWSLATSRLSAAPLVAHGGPVRYLAFDPRGNLLAAAANGYIDLWNLATHRRIETLGDGSAAVGGLAFSPDGSTLAAVVGCDLDLWDPSDGVALGPPIDLHYVVALARGTDFFCQPDGGLAFAADGSLVVNLGSYGPIYVWSPVLTATSSARVASQICAVDGGANVARAEYSAQLPGQAYKRTCAG